MNIWSHRVVIVLFAVIGGAIFAAPASADIVGAGADETIQQAYGPLRPSVNYRGVFNDPNDVDYLRFNVASAGERLHFTISNTMTSCKSPDQDYCPVWATLMDQSDQQVGGATSSAGTVATVDDTETIDWTFAQPGTYYVVMQSNGNLPPGQPTYTVTMGPPPIVGPVVRSLAVPRHQRGNRVKVTVTFGQPVATLRATLFALGARGRQTYVARLTRHSLAARTYRLTLRLSALYRRRLKQRKRLPLLLKLTVVSSSGTRLHYARRVTLRR